MNNSILYVRQTHSSVCRSQRFYSTFTMVLKINMTFITFLMSTFLTFYSYGLWVKRTTELQKNTVKVVLTTQ